MNPKNALFISASLTAFVLAVLFGVVTKITTSSTQVAAAAPVVQVAAAQDTATATQQQPTDVPVATAQIPPTPDEAALLAAKAINRQDVYSVESSTYQGVQSYKVVFSSGDVVYIGLDKQVLAQTKLQPAVASVDSTQAPTKQHRKNYGNGNGGGNGGGGGGGGGGGDDGGHDD
jgi:uncharacterized membrane protein YgcG